SPGVEPGSVGVEGFGVAQPARSTVASTGTDRATRTDFFMRLTLMNLARKHHPTFDPIRASEAASATEELLQRRELLLARTALLRAAQTEAGTGCLHRVSPRSESLLLRGPLRGV